MSVITESIFIDALSLPARERAALVEKLLLSLEPQETSAEIEEAWKREALDRCRAYDDGKLTERFAAEVLNDAERKAK
ncbi:MAG TPA: addiction module protein [Verrucomicrobiae bacterium]